MGSFYGNVTKSSRTQFRFDRIYPNRRTMEDNMNTDGIYMGRFVLVDYDEGATNQYKKIYVDKNGKYYFLTSETKLTEVLYPTDVKKDEFVLVTSHRNTENSITDETQFFIYQCSNTESKDIEVPVPATFTRVTSEDASNAYANNFEIDRKYYGAGRGYDSTVWQKVFVNNEEKYVMVAELNAVVPTFDIVVDPPTLEPIAPHFDRVSNSVYYKVHYQPQWGMRVKAATPKEGTSSDMTTTQSDEQVTWQHYSYSRADDKEEVTTENVAGAIYYNKAGFDKKNIVYSQAKIEEKEEKDKITITPTGISGYEYNIHNDINNPKETAKKEDIQEISVILPSIGDSIAEMWDLVYGDSEQNDNKSVRNLDVEWNSTEGLRMVREDETGNGWTYEPKKVETLAGGINAIHDLMGMIIIDDKELYPQKEKILDEDKQNEIASKVNLDNIYYDLTTSTYNRKIKKFKYTDILNTDEVYSIDDKNPVDLTKEPYKPNTFFVKNENGTYVPDENSRGQEGPYYKRLLNVPPLEEVELLDWMPNTYFYKEKYENTDAYILDGDSKRDEDKVYFSVNGFTTQEDGDGKIIVPFELKNTYVPNKFWYEDASVEIEPAENTTYYDYKKAEEETPVSNRDYFIVSFNKVTKKPYIPGKYAYEYEKDGEKFVGFCDKTEEEFLAEKIDLYDVTGIEPKVETKNIWDEALGDYRVETITTLDLPRDEETGKISLQPVDVFVLSKGEYYYQKADAYVRVISSKVVEDNNITKIYTANRVEKIEGFYIPSTYYYKPSLNINRYVLDTSKEATAGRLYYSPDIENEKIITNFYEPNKYYYDANDGSKVIDKGLMKTENRIYFIGEDFYVVSDSQNAFDVYSLWNNNVKLVPSSVTLARREDRWGFKELDGFARSMNTIHGLILEVNKIMEFDNIYTRELDTVQGCINKLNDIIFKFDQLTPGNILVVDSCGRAHGATYTAAQTFGYTNFGTNGVMVDSKETENRWISLQVDDNAKNPKIIIKHNITEVTSTETASDKNGGAISGDLFAGINHNTNDTLKLYSPIVDKTGHIVGNNYETVTLPYGYKTIAVANNGKDLATVANAKNETIVADSITDTVTIDAGNRWIRMVGDSTNDKITIYHNAPNPNSQSPNTTKTGNETPAFGATFEIPEVKYDEAGHIFNVGTHTVKIPQPSLGTRSESSVAYDEGESWVVKKIELNSTTGAITQVMDKIGELTLSGYIKPDNGVFGPENTLNVALNKLQGQTISLQDQINQEKTDRENAIKKIAGNSTETIESLSNKVKALQETLDSLLKDLVYKQG